MKGIFITGTDTGVGKTYVSRALIRGWRARDVKVGVMKPCETGCGLSEEGVGTPQDASLLLEASGSSLTIEEVCPFRFAQPLAPAEAAAKEGAFISFSELAEAYRQIASRHEVTLVEGAGGLLVPFSGNQTAADLALELGLPLVIVARIGLGTLNHTWLTLEAAQARGLRVLGVIFTRSEDPAKVPPGPDEALNPETLNRLTGVRILANLPFSKEPPEVDFGF